MSTKALTAALAGFALLALSAAPGAASVYDKKTRLTVSETIEVPGAILAPGEYVMKLVDSQSNRHIVQFLNSDENQVLSTVIAIPNWRLRPTGDTELSWYETPAGQPPALRAWFYPGDSFGQEFAYPAGRAAELAQGSQRSVMQTEAPSDAQADTLRDSAVTAVDPSRQTTEDYESALSRNEELDREQPQAAQPPPARSAPVDESDTLAQAQPAERPEVTQEEAARPAPQAEPDPSPMPETAGFGGLLLLAGLGALGASALVRRTRRS